MQRLFVNATFYTQWPQQPIATALLTRGERIVALGAAEEIRAHATGPVETVDLGGAFVSPGFNDAHIHAAEYAREITALDIRESRSLEEALAGVSSYASSLPADAWIFGGRWDYNTWTVPTQPDRYVLDHASGGRPAALPSIDGHTIWANSAALAAVGITRDTPDPVGGEIVRDAQGEPTGILRETAGDSLAAIMNSPAAGDLGQQLKEGQKRLLATGLTSIHCFDGEDARAAYRKLYDDGALHLRVHKSIPVTSLDLAIDEGRATGHGDHWLSTGPVKLFSDGALGSHTCHMNQEFPGENGNTGIEVIPFAELSALVRKAASAGIGVATHAIGDRANQLVLDAYQELFENPLDPNLNAVSNGATQLRHRIEHTQHLRPQDVARLASLGVVPSMQPTHCTTDIPLASTLLADHDLASYAWRSLTDAGAVLAFGSDAPIEAPDPLYGIHAAVTRQNKDNAPDGGWQPRERLSVAEAIAGFTTGPAYASGEEAIKGRLRPGMLADFVALEHNPFDINPSQLRHLKVKATIVGGDIKYWNESL